MAITRQLNALGQMRLDIPDIRAVESAVANDFDLLAGKIWAGKQAEIVRGFTVPVTNTAGNPATALTLNVANGLVFHFNATEAGTLLEVDPARGVEALNNSNARVVGSFASAAVNYVGIDYTRYEDSNTSDTTKFLDPNTKQEIDRRVPKARILDYTIIITTAPFSFNLNVCPVAIVVTDSSGNVLSITDARQMMFRLGAGGDTPNADEGYSWSDTTRRENSITYDSISSSADPFSGGDKNIFSMKEWMNAVTHVLWEAKSGESWYSPTSRDMMKVAYGSTVFADTGDNFGWNLATSNFRWTNISVLFENSSGSYYNTVSDKSIGVTSIARVSTTVTVTTSSVHGLIPTQVVYVDSADSNFPAGNKTIVGTPTTSSFTYTESGSAVSGVGTFLVYAGLTISDGQCLYVDIDRKTSPAPTIIAAIGTLQSLPSPIIPGSRIIIAWRKGNDIQIRDRAYPLGRRGFSVATTSSLGIVELNATPNSSSSPQVLTVGVNGAVVTSALSGNTNGFTSTGSGSGVGIEGFGAASGNTSGIQGNGHAGGTGVIGIGGATDGSAGMAATSIATNGYGISGIGTGFGNGVTGLGGNVFSSGIDGAGGVFTGGPANGAIGVIGKAGGSTGSLGLIVAATTTVGILGVGRNTGAGVEGNGGVSGGPGVEGHGGNGASSVGVKGKGGTTDGSIGVLGLGGSSGTLGSQSNSTPNPGIFGVGCNTSAGIEGNGGPNSGTGVIGNGGLGGDSIGVYAQGNAAGSGVVGIGGASGYGIVAQATAGSPTRSAFRIVPQAGPPSSAQLGDIYCDSVSHVFYGYSGSAWVALY